MNAGRPTTPSGSPASGATTPSRMSSASPALPHPAHARRDGRRRLWHLLQHRAVRPHAGRADRQPGGAAGEGGAEGDLSVRLAGRGGREHGRQMYPDQSLYPVDAVPNVVRRINNALRRCDQIARLGGRHDDTYWMAPIIADAEAGFGGALNALRADEGHDRGRRRRRPLRGPARLRKEVRPSGRQGAGADRSSISGR